MRWIQLQGTRRPRFCSESSVACRREACLCPWCEVRKVELKTVPRYHALTTPVSNASGVFCDHVTSLVSPVASSGGVLIPCTWRLTLVPVHRWSLDAAIAWTLRCTQDRHVLSRFAAPPSKPYPHRAGAYGLGPGIFNLTTRPGQCVIIGHLEGVAVLTEDGFVAVGVRRSPHCPPHASHTSHRPALSHAIPRSAISQPRPDTLHPSEAVQSARAARMLTSLSRTHNASSRNRRTHSIDHHAYAYTFT